MVSALTSCRRDDDGRDAETGNSSFDGGAVAGGRLREPLQLEQVGCGDGCQRQQAIADRAGGRLGDVEGARVTEDRIDHHGDAGFRALDTGDCVSRRDDGLGRGEVARQHRIELWPAPIRLQRGEHRGQALWRGTAWRAILPRPGRLASNTVGIGHTSWPSHCSAGAVAVRPTLP